MKLSANPLPAAKAAAIAAVNGRFAALADPHRDQAHRRKREIAAQFLRGDGCTDEFAAEAALRGLDVKSFAAVIVVKPDPIDARELARQKLMFAIEAARSLGELATIKSDPI
jgi:predicted phosphatase